MKRPTNVRDKVCGRYAPSPTGRLHFGNLRTALLSWLQCRLAKGVFVLRIDDLDKPRNHSGAIERIIKDLEWLGLDWDDGPGRGRDGDEYLQSARAKLYEQAFQHLFKQKKLYPCYCSRKDITLALSAPHFRENRSVYPGTCRPLTPESFFIVSNKQMSWRYRVDDTTVSFVDRIMGRQKQKLRTDAGDFIVKRRDGLFAYQLASVVDDALLQVTDIVRGGDLIDSTPRQIALLQSLGYPIPNFWHVPLMTDKQGQPFSKRDGSDSLEKWRANGGNAETLVGKLAFSVGLIDREESLSARDLLQNSTLADFRQRLVQYTKVSHH